MRRLEVLDRDGWRCRLCGRKIDRRYRWPDRRSGVADHIVPLSRGGEDTMANAQAAHARCNARKHAGSLGAEQLRLMG